MVKILVIGAGVSGLSTAVCLQKSCDTAHVTVLSELFPPEDIVSMVAGGITLAGKASELEKKTPAVIRDIIGISMNYFTRLARDGNALIHGVRERYGYYLVGTEDYGMSLEPEELPLVAEILGDYRECSPDELQKLVPAHPCSGWFLKTCMVDNRIYLPFLMHQLIQNGGSLVRQKVETLTEVVDGYDVIVNCTGLGSKTLVSDPDMYPIKGQVARVHTGERVEHFMRISKIIDPYTNKPMTGYILPHAVDAVVGGTHESHVDSRHIEHDAMKKIFDLAETFEPKLKDCHLLSTYTGIRPVRSSGLRLEKQTLDFNGAKKPVIHNYGHGGRGITLSWGCAVKVSEMVNEIIRSSCS